MPLADYDYVVLPKRGQAVGDNGGFAIAFLMRNRDGSQERRFRFYHRELQGGKALTKQRLSLISKFITANKARLPYFVDFIFHDKLLRLSTGSVLSGIEMNVAGGTSISSIIRDLQSGEKEINTDFFARAASNFFKMGETFFSLGIAHGDLSFDNIFIDRDANIYLVDYDSVFVPEMRDNFCQTTGGAEGFQHPLRFTTHGLKCTSRDDDFSFIVIYLFLLGMSKRDSGILHKIANERAVFMPQTLESEAALLDSSLFKALRALASSDRKIKNLCDLLAKAVRSRSLIDIPCIFSLPTAERRPMLKSASYCIICGHHFESPHYRHCIICGARRHIYTV